MARLIFFLVVLLSATSCTEPYALQSNTFESALVIEGTITNELKQQQILISRTYRLEEDGPQFESGANVTVTDDLGNTFEFEQQDTVYVSTTAFTAEPGRSYQLSITTADGGTYRSTQERLTTVTPIESVVVTPQTQNGKLGARIAVNSHDPTGTSKYYRYEFTETGRVIAPYWSDKKAILEPPNETDNALVEVLIVDRVGEMRKCYTSRKSDKLILTSTTDLSEDRVQDFQMNFVGTDDYLIADRYSINVRQYVQNLASYTFYKTLSEISGSGSILSQNQPGFFYGNIRSQTDPSEKVIGFFEVSSVSEKRVFFNFGDVFPSEPLPGFPFECQVEHWDRWDLGLGGAGHRLINAIRNETLLFYTFDELGWFVMVSPVCGDCTKFSSNVVPSFWID